ncbi:hypothetical protein E0K83_11900 [Gramella sp. BOM4]|nr:hypothetical protein [Christiangramia bathymodioli]
MKRLLQCSICFMLIFSFGTYAQIQKGNFMIGSDVGSGLVNAGSNSLLGINFGLNEGAGFNLGISPKGGYFVQDNLLIGGAINLGFTKSAETNGEAAETFQYGIQALTRYYLSPGEQGIDNLLKHGRFFAEANAGLAGVNVNDGATTNGFAFGVGPGYSYFVTETVALEALFKYNALVGAGNTNYQHSLGLNLGIQVFLPFSKTKNIEDEDF